MGIVHQLLQTFSNLPGLVQTAGYAGMALIIFTETGLFFGFFLPGDSLIVTASLLSAQGHLPLNPVLLGVLLNVAAILGDNTNYWIGRFMGPRVFHKEDSLFFRRKHLEEAHAFYVRNGPKTVVLCRFVPIVRTFAPLVAGAGYMDYRVFFTFSMLGGTAWIWSMILIGYFLGTHVPGVAKHIDLVVIGVIFVSILPGIIGYLRKRRTQVAPIAPSNS